MSASKHPDSLPRKAGGQTPAALPLLNAHGSGSSVGLPTLGGICFPRGMVKDAANLVISGPDGKPCASGARNLVRWPDGSTRWALIHFLATQTGSHRVQTNAEPKSRPTADAPTPVRISHNGAHCTLDNGLLRVTLATDGPSPISQIELKGKKMLASADAFRLCADSATSAHETARSIRVEEQNDICARVRIDGAHVDPAGQKTLTYRLTLELWAGWPSLRMDYHFFHLIAGVDELNLKRLSVEMDLSTRQNARRVFLQSYHDVLYVPRVVENTADVAIVSDDTRGPAHVEDPAMLLDDVKYPSQLRPPLVDTAPWLGIASDSANVFLGMQDFAELRPKRLWSASAKIGVDIWPEFAGNLALPQGCSRRASMTLAFTDPGQTDPSAVAALLGAPHAEGRGTVTPAWIAHCKEFRQDRILPAGQHARFEHFFGRLCNVQMPQGMFDLGDTPDSHYQLVYLPLGADFCTLKPNAPQIPRVFNAGGQHMMHPSALPQLYEPVWTNNEYDLIHALATEMLRKGGGYFAQLSRAVRHNIEVDFVHYNDYRWCHRATPTHCPGHTRNGAYPSHFWTQGLLEYHCLTGDADALEVAMALGDKIIEVFNDPGQREVLWGFNRELGWPMLALSCLADITGEKRYLDMLDQIVDFLIAFDREHFGSAIKLAGVNPRHSFVRQMLGGFYGYASMIEGIDFYVDLRQDRPEVKRWFIDLLRDLRGATWQAQLEGQSLDPWLMISQAMAIGFERTGEAEFLDAGMACVEQLFDSTGWLTPTPEAKPIAMLHRGLVRFLSHALLDGRLNHLEYASRRGRADGEKSRDA